MPGNALYPSKHRGPTVPTATRRNDVLFRSSSGAMSTSGSTVKLDLGVVPVVPPGPWPFLPAAWPTRGGARASAEDAEQPQEQAAEDGQRGARVAGEVLVAR
jgi:hypothetical protein